MKPILLLITICCISLLCFSQQTRFALVKPDGSTSIFTDLGSAYNAATDSDAIYMPGGLYTLPVTLEKKIHFYGAGIDPDSSQVTQSTILHNVNNTYFGGYQNLYLYATASGSSFEGIVFLDEIKTFAASNVSYKRCKFLVGLDMGSNGGINNIVEDCILQDVFYSTSSIIRRNIITSQISGSTSYCLISNNIFLTAQNNGLNATHSTWENNIFLTLSPMGGTNNNNVYTNNLVIDTLPLANSISDIESNTIHVNSISDIFINYPNTNQFSFGYDFHLKLTCLGNDAGTDGTDVGIYGTAYPTPEGWVPSNPHIFFIDVAPESNNNGKLPIHFKVRTGN